MSRKWEANKFKRGDLYSRMKKNATHGREGDIGDLPHIPERQLRIKNIRYNRDLNE